MDTHSAIVNIEPFAKELCEELGALCKGDVFFYGDPSFMHHNAIFNGNVVSMAKVVVCPLNAEDISRVILFCNKYSLSPSVKAGGYGTGGWAIGGDVIIDLCKITDADIEPPHPDGSYTSLNDVSSTNSKGRKAVSMPPAFITGKKRREDDIALGMYDFASLKVANFLRTPLGLDIQNFPVSGLSGRAYQGLASEESEKYNSPRSLGNSDALSNSDQGSPYSNNSSMASGTNTVLTIPSPDATTCAIPTTTIPLQSSTEPFGYMDSSPALNTSYSFGGLLRPLLLANMPVRQPVPLNYATDGLLSNRLLNPSQFTLHVEVEPIYPHAFVTFGAGIRQKEIDAFTANQKLEARYITGYGDGIPYHVPFAAHPVGSSNMLLGGFGFLGRLHGLSIDNLVEAEMVLADGRVVVVNKDSYPDLWWALRGAGTAFGVATRYKAKAFPVPVVFAGNLIYRFNKATAPSLIKHYRDCVKNAPRELYANVLLTAGPAGKDSLVVIQMCYVGPKERGQEFLAAISSWDGENCLLNEVDEKSFLHQQDSVAQVLRGKAGRQWFIRSALISSLPDDVINDTVIKFADTPLGCTWLFELAGGAITDFEDNCVPKSQREAAFTIAALHQWEMDIKDDRCMESAEGWISDTLGRVALGGPFPSFLGRHEPPERTKACFGQSWERLCEIKKRYDPHNVFKNTFWPLNAQGDMVDPRTHEPPTPQIKPKAL
ncbi:hypothetical protein AX15_004319 [Amanita polypyramis BW_CC]|nr:hypothetical protein AX15_004319 [Amanita polypyramis BW_CC]